MFSRTRPLVAMCAPAAWLAAVNIPATFPNISEPAAGRKCESGRISSHSQTGCRNVSGKQLGCRFTTGHAEMADYTASRLFTETSDLATSVSSQPKATLQRPDRRAVVTIPRQPLTICEGQGRSVACHSRLAVLTAGNQWMTQSSDCSTRSRWRE